MTAYFINYSTSSLLFIILNRGGFIFVNFSAILSLTFNKKPILMCDVLIHVTVEIGRFFCGNEGRTERKIEIAEFVCKLAKTVASLSHC